MRATIEIPDQVIIDMIITALEGGSNYWYYLPDITMVTGERRVPLAERIAQQCLAGTAVIPVYDKDDIDEDTGFPMEGKEKLGDLSKENIERAALTYCQNEHAISDDLDYDANDADVLFQYIILNDIVYG